jgi:excinuclease ABC subunit C
MNLEKIKKLNIPSSPGCYQFYDKKGDIIYIGKAANLKNRVLSYWHRSVNHTPAKSAMVEKAVNLEWIAVESEIEALLLESNLIKKHQPYYNVLLRDDKRFNYIKISTEDEIPGVFITRKIDKAGKYFGPFTSGTAVRETVKAIRKIWPYCTERRIKPKPCFYYQIGRCTGVCGQKLNLKEYKEKIIKPIVLFLEGKKERLIKNYELRIKNYELRITSFECGKNKYNLSEKEYEDEKNELGILKFQVFNMKKVLEHTNVLSIGEKYAADVIELAKILSLLKVPERIEGYDISNIFGQEATGSMVVFSGGEPNKNEYRKFKIRIDLSSAKASADEQDYAKVFSGIGDVQMLVEVLERRFKHGNFVIPAGLSGEQAQAGIQKKNNKTAGFWPSPDLIIIDGGKGQLNAASRVLKKYKLDIPIIAVSKGAGLRSAIAPDKLFFPGEKKPLELPLASPALHIIKRVRDEAHRFAIEYHRKLKRKKMF